MIDQREILSRVDHTILSPTATWAQVKTACDEGIRFIVESVDKNRIDRIRMILPVKEEADTGESA